jgi:hypothetical protein
MSETIIFHRKFRWLLEVLSPDGQEIYLPPCFVKVSDRPGVIASGQKQTITFTVYEADFELTKRLGGTVYQPVELVAKLSLLDGCGASVEEWVLRKAFIKGFRLHNGYIEFDLYCDESDYRVSKIL